MDDEGKENTLTAGVTSNNEDFTNAGVISIRLNTDPMINKIELYLKGQESRYIESKDGLVQEELFNIAQSKANVQGVFSIMSWIKATINSQIVQGNFRTFDELYIYLREYRMNLSENIMINLYDWEVEERDFEGIIDMIMSMVEPFMSRLVGNKERESYTNTIQHSEKSDTQREGRRGFPFFG